MLPIWAFLKAINPRTWLIVGLSATVLYVGMHLYHLGIEHEQVKARNQVLDQDAQQAKKERDVFEQQVHDSQLVIQNAVAAQAAATARLADISGRLANQQAQMAAIQNEIQKLPDPALVGDIRIRLALHPGDRATSLYPDELRASDQAIAERDGLKSELGTMNDKIAALDDRNKAQGDEIFGLAKQTKALESYAQQLHGHYQTAYNLAQPRVGLFMKIITFGLKRQKKLALPAPESFPVPGEP